MKTKKPAVKKVTKKKVTKTTGLSNKTKKFNKMVDDLSGASRFADKDFNFNKFPSQIKVNTEDKSNITCKVTTLPYEIEGEPAFNCNKWTFMCLLLAIGLMLLATSHGDFLSVAWNLKH